MLLYHPATDFFHCWMRFASVLCDCNLEYIEYDKVRIIDFFLCFPNQIDLFHMPRNFSSELKKIVRRLPKSYEDPNSIRQAFPQMSKIHGQVAMDMVSKGIILGDKFKTGVLEPNNYINSKELLESVANEWATKGDQLYKLTLKVMISIPLNGKGGLKDRSGLMEYKYDG